GGRGARAPDAVRPARQILDPPRHAVQEAVDEDVARLGVHGLRVKLQPGHGVARVPDGHDRPVLGAGRDAQLGGEPRAGDDERVVARRLERVREAGEQTTPVVADAGRLAVHRTPGAHDAGTVRGADALVPQAYAEDGDRRPEPPHDVRRNPRFARRTGPRGDDDMRRPKSLDLLVRRSVVASYNGLFSQLAHVAGQVVDERVVIVDQQDHGTRAAMSPRALSSVSRYSSAGSESATMPPPTWKYTSLPSTRQVRITMLVSAAPESERYPMEPQYAARWVGSSSAMICIARTLGAPVTEPPGNAARRRSRASYPDASSPTTVETRCCTVAYCSTRNRSGALTVPGRQTRDRSFRNTSTIIAFS